MSDRRPAPPQPRRRGPKKASCQETPSIMPGDRMPASMLKLAPGIHARQQARTTKLPHTNVGQFHISSLYRRPIMAQTTQRKAELDKLVAELATLADPETEGTVKAVMMAGHKTAIVASHVYDGDRGRMSTLKMPRFAILDESVLDSKHLGPNATIREIDFTTYELGEARLGRVWFTDMAWTCSEQDYMDALTTAIQAVVKSRQEKPRLLRPRKEKDKAQTTGSSAATAAEEAAY